MATVEASQKRTRIIQQFSFAVGHVINDVTLLLMLSFRLVFFMKVVNMSASNAGWIMLSSRVSNAIVIRPIVGYLCDKVSIPVLSRRHGKRKSWHLIGTVLQVVSVPLLFSNCLVCSSEPSQWQLIAYYGTINTLAWISIILIQTAHLSIIPSIAKGQKEAVKLNGLRMTLVFLTGTVSFLVAFAVLGQDDKDQLTAESVTDFTMISLILIGAGLVFAIIFHVGTKEPSNKLVKTKRNDDEVLSNNTQVPPHKQESNIHRPIGLHDYQNPTNEQLTNGTEVPVRKTSKEVTMSEVKKCAGIPSYSETNENVNELTCNGSEHGASDGEHLNNTGKKTADRDKTHDTETLGDDSEAFSLSLTNSLGVDNKGFDCNGKESPSCSPDQITVAKVDEVNMNDVLPKSSEQNHDVAVSETLTSKKPSVVSCDLESALPAKPEPKTVRAWLKDPHLYKVAFIFACAKTLQDISYSYLPLFLTDRLDFRKEAIANLPLVVMISATVSAAISKKLIGKIGGKWSYILAALLALGSCVWFYFITQSTRALTYPAAALLGFGFSAMLVNSFSFTTELIGDNKTNSGFVFSVLGISKSLIEGALYGVIQSLFPRKSGSDDCEECGNYVRHIFSIVPGSLAIISLLIVLLFQASHTTWKKNAASIVDAPTQTDATLLQTDASVKTEIISTEPERNQ